MRNRTQALAQILLGLAFVVFASTHAFAQIQYAAKFVCGIPGIEAEREAVKPANYATAVNFHNPTRNTIQFQKKAVRALPQGFDPIPPSRFRPEVLRPNFALEVDCQNIRDLLGGPPAPDFITGFLVIQSPQELDVAAVYSGQPLGGIGGMTLDVEAILPGRLVAAPGRSGENHKSGNGDKNKM